MTIENHDFEEDQDAGPLIPHWLAVGFAIGAVGGLIIAWIADIFSSSPL